MKTELEKLINEYEVAIDFQTEGKNFRDGIVKMLDVKNQFIDKVKKIVEADEKKERRFEKFKFLFESAIAVVDALIKNSPKTDRTEEIEKFQIELKKQLDSLGVVESKTQADKDRFNHFTDALQYNLGMFNVSKCNCWSITNKLGESSKVYECTQCKKENKTIFNLKTILERCGCSRTFENEVLIKDDKCDEHKTHFIIDYGTNTYSTYDVNSFHEKLNRLSPLFVYEKFSEIKVDIETNQYTLTKR